MDSKKIQKLTENLIYQRIKSCPRDLSKITQLNITGRHLVDVSLLSKLTGLEILSLSVNKINTLAYFMPCRKLKALFLRQNKIRDLNEIKYLMSLPHLSRLSLLENPCASDPNYRETAIKNLKYLIELDDVPIIPEERRKALKYGLELSEDFEPFIEKSPSEDIDYDFLDKSDNVQDSIMDDENRYDVLNKEPDSDLNEETKSISNQSSVNYKLKTEPKLLPSCQKEQKVEECKTNNFQAEVSPQEDKLRNPISNRYSAVLILMKELDRLELEALHAEVCALLGFPVLDSQT